MDAQKDIYERTLKATNEEHERWLKTATPKEIQYREDNKERIDQLVYERLKGICYP